MAEKEWAEHPMEEVSEQEQNAQKNRRRERNQEGEKQKSTKTENDNIIAGSWCRRIKLNLQQDWSRNRRKGKHNQYWEWKEDHDYTWQRLKRMIIRECCEQL